MKWTLENWVGYIFTFQFEGTANSLTVFAKGLDEAVGTAKSLLREGSEIDVTGWEDEY